MDPSLLCEVTYDDSGDGGNPLGDLTEEDIVLLDGDYHEGEEGVSPGAKRPFKGKGSSTPPVKKVRRLPPAKRLPSLPPKLVPPPSPAAVAASLLRNKQLSVSARTSPAAAPARPAMKQSITWKYRQLAENQYTADIKKPDLLKNYEPEQCACRVRRDEEDEACGSGCVNRSTYTECDAEVCKNGSQCSNMAIQRRQYAPGLERFMTAKKGWGVRARQSVSKGAFILEYTGEICSSAAFEARMHSRYTTDNHHYCLAMDNKTMIDAHRAGSECRFVNHSCEPNCEMEKWTVGGLSRMALFSLRDILPGEEICYDYNFSLFNTDQGQECKCGARACRGVIGGKGKDYLITIEDEPAAKLKANPPPAPPPLDPGSETGLDLAWFLDRLGQQELEIIQKEAPRQDQLPGKNIKCTVCNEQLNYQNRGDIHRHPELGVVMCTKCHKNFGVGGWTQDAEGNDEFCRWCSEGGQIFLCDFCPQAFCNKCLRWNLGRKYLKKIEDEEKWHCLNCEASPLREQRAIYWAITQHHKAKAAEKAARRSVLGAPNTPKKGAKGQGVTNGRTPGGKVNGQEPSVSTAYQQLQLNSAISVGPATSPNKGPNTSPSKGPYESPNKGPAASPHAPGPRPNGVHRARPKAGAHFLEPVLGEVEESLQHLLRLAQAIRGDWAAGSRTPASVSSTAKRLRTVLEQGKHSMAELDRKVVNTYRGKVKGADMKDIKPEGGKGVKEEKGVKKEPVEGKKEATVIFKRKDVRNSKEVIETSKKKYMKNGRDAVDSMKKKAIENGKEAVVASKQVRSGKEETENIKEKELKKSKGAVNSSKIKDAKKKDTSKTSEQQDVNSGKFEADAAKPKEPKNVKEAEESPKQRNGQETGGDSKQDDLVKNGDSNQDDLVKSDDSQQDDVVKNGDSKQDDLDRNGDDVGEASKQKEVKNGKKKGADGLEYLVIVATEGEAVIEDVVRNEAVPKSKEKEQEGVHDVSIPEVEDKILEHVTNGRVTELEDESLEPGVGDAGTEAGAEPLVDSVTEVKAKGEVKDINSHGDHKDEAKLKLSSTGKDQTSQEKES